MLQDFRIVHRLKPRLFAEDSQFPVWSTCLRSLGFATTSVPQVGDQIFTQAEAYTFLLEIICGLHSPIIGETEVMGQFKIFAQAWVADQPGRHALVQRLLADAKALRDEHLVHLGTQSYGSWLRKNVHSSQVHVLGAGHLAREIHPYLAKQGRVTIHSRSGCSWQASSVQRLDQQAFTQGALIIAAPVSAAFVQHWLSGRKPSEIVDLRDTSNSDPIPGAVSLNQVFVDIEKNKSRLVPVIAKIKEDIRARSRSLAAAEKLRPLGWDDLCA
jgi:glutamyl-tRNA reductase